MIRVFQGETGGNLEFSFSNDLATSGYLDVVNGYRQMYRFDGTVGSGILYIAKSGIAESLEHGQYTLLPQVIDVNNLVYFLQPDELHVQEVPDFFSEAVLISSSSLLVRLDDIESRISELQASDKTYRHVQMSASSVWVIQHDLNKYVSVTVRDSSGDIVFGKVEWLSLNAIRLTFSAPFSGEAYCN